MGFDAPAVPISAILDAPMTGLTIAFDKTLQNELSLDTANWTVRWNNLNRTVTGGVASGTSVVLTLTPGGADAGIDRVDFSPPPDDVITAENALPVVAFTDFPVTM